MLGYDSSITNFGLDHDGIMLHNVYPRGVDHVLLLLALASEGENVIRVMDEMSCMLFIVCSVSCFGKYVWLRTGMQRHCVR